MSARRRGVILPIVLFMLLLLGMLGAMFAFRVNADLAATQAVTYRLQTKLAAEAGVERVKLMLRSSRMDLNRWYDNPEELHRILVWAHDTDPTVWGTNEELEEGAMAYRFSIVADDPSDDEDFVRFGITDESAKLNLNQASEDQLLVLVRAAVGDNEEINPQEIVDAILDWRDADPTPRGENGDTEAEYYRSLDKPYRIKNGPFDTVEEMLLVKGVTPEIFYGEDYDRNGLLTPNEDDGDDTYPPDNEDNHLNRGLYPYLTVYSSEDNVSNDNRPRIYLFGDEKTLAEELSEVFEDDPGIVDFIVQATRGAGAGGGGGSGGDNAGSGDKGSVDDRRRPDGNTGMHGFTGEDKSQTRQQVKGDEGEDPDDEGDEADSIDSEGDPGDEPEGEGDESGDEDETGPGGGESDDAASAARPIRTPAALLRERAVGGELVVSPIGVEHLATLMDRTTSVPAQQQRLVGLINVNTAPALVLRCIEELTDEQIGDIVATRLSLDSDAKATTAWLVMEEVVDLDTYENIAPKITARGQQFTVEALGYAEHIGMVSRIQVVVDMMGPIPQTIYYRDLTQLGGHYPIREEDLERVRVR